MKTSTFNFEHNWDTESVFNRLAVLTLIVLVGWAAALAVFHPQHSVAHLHHSLLVQSLQIKPAEGSSAAAASQSDWHPQLDACQPCEDQQADGSMVWWLTLLNIVRNN